MSITEEDIDTLQHVIDFMKDEWRYQEDTEVMRKIRNYLLNELTDGAFEDIIISTRNSNQED